MIAKILHINYLAVVVSGMAYWVLGSLWFSLLVGEAWAKEIELHGVKIKEPTKKELLTKLITTFAFNLIVALGVALITAVAGISTLADAIFLGLTIGLCFSAATFGIVFTWEGRNLKLMAFDMGYPVLGILLTTIVITYWK